jgi:hypothetical protein
VQAARNRCYVSHKVPRRIPVVKHLKTNIYRRVGHDLLCTFCLCPIASKKQEDVEKYIKPLIHNINLLNKLLQQIKAK